MDKDKKVIKIPITHDERKINEFGNGYVPCQVSGRWLQFPDTATDDRWIFVDVMTMSEDKKPRKLCEMVLSKEDIMRAINSIKIVRE